MMAICVCICMPASVCECMPQHSDVGKDVAGQNSNSQSAGEVVALLVAAVTQVNGVLQLLVVGVSLEDHLTQEGIFDDVVVPNLSAELNTERKRGRGGRRTYRLVTDTAEGHDSINDKSSVIQFISLVFRSPNGVRRGKKVKKLETTQTE